MRISVTALLTAGTLLVAGVRAQETPPTQPDKPAAAAETSNAEPPDASKPARPPAADAPAADEQPTDEKPTGEKPSADKPLKPLDDGLESLDPKKDDKDLLEEAIRGMRKAQGLIEEEQATDETLKTQKDVVTNLDELIKQLQREMQKPPSQSSSSQQNKNQQKSLANVQQQKQKQKQQQQQAQPKPQAGEKPEKKAGEDKGSRESTESKEQRARREAEEARRRKLNQDVWGHLPEHLRAALMNVDDEKYLPRYAEFVRQYYETLAEKSKDRP